MKAGAHSFLSLRFTTRKAAPKAPLPICSRTSYLSAGSYKVPRTYLRTSSSAYRVMYSTKKPESLASNLYSLFRYVCTLAGPRDGTNKLENGKPLAA